MPDEKLIEAVSHANDDLVFDLVEGKVESDEDPMQVLADLTEGMKLLGERFACGKAYIPEVVYGAETFSKAIEMLRPKLGDVVDKKDKKEKVLMATVRGDVHDIGKGLVATFLDLAGYEVVDLGHDIANEQIFEAIERENPDVVGLSALMTTTMLQQREFINDLNLKGMRDRVKVIVGGAPITQGWADQIGADAFGADALDGRRKIDSLLGY
jgi:corrinoid protein of di/trimethylamine methyltransferase